MIHFELCYKKYHRSIIKNVIKASQKRHEAFLIAKLPTLQEVPKKSPDVWALCAHRTGNRSFNFFPSTLIVSIYRYKNSILN